MTANVTSVSAWCSLGAALVLSALNGPVCLCGK